MADLASQLDALDPALRERLAQRGFDPAQLIHWANDDRSADARNRIGGTVEPVPEALLQPVDPTAANRGEAAIAAGEVAVCVLAGGMATRMGGVVKSLVEVVDGHTFLDLRLAELAALGAAGGNTPPLWLMTSEPTDGPIRSALDGHPSGVEATTFEQLVSLRLTEGGDVFVEDGEPSVYATGHGDLPDALRRTDLLQRFIDGGGKYVWISNIDNLGVSVDPAILGGHIQSDAPVTVEVCEKYAGDKGGGPVLHDGAPIICETFRLPLGFDPDRVRVFNTNTFIVDAEALADLSLDWTYVRVEKSVEDRTAVQFERLLGEITVALKPRFCLVPREGDDSRFLPVKSHADLEAIRPAAARIAAAHGLG